MREQTAASTKGATGAGLRGMGRRPFLAILAATPSALSSRAAQTQTRGPVRVVVPYGAGGGVDVVARIIAPHIASRLGLLSVIIENRPGASGNVGMEVVARGPTNGTVLGAAAENNVVTNRFFALPSFDPDTELAPIALMVFVHNPLVCGPSVPVDVRTAGFAAFLDWARSVGRPLTYATTAVGNMPHLGFEMLRRLAGFDGTRILYGSLPAALNDIARGDVDAMFLAEGVARPMIEGGRVVALALPSPGRSSSLPSVPTVAESGFPGFEAMSFFGLVARSGNPPGFLAEVEDAVRHALADPGVAASLVAQGFVPAAGSTREGYAARVREETRKWAQFVQDARIGVD